MKPNPFMKFLNFTNQLPEEQLKMIKGGDGDSGGNTTVNSNDSEEDER